jgi:xenotropic and polytropic retrovirus receptor 1
MEQEQPNIEKCSYLENYTLAIVFLPFWFRFAQCLRRYHDTKLKPNLVNAGKYFSVILIYFADIFRVKLRTDYMLYIVLAIRIFSTLYSYAWDLYMDWGLLRSREPKKRFLRTKLLFSPWFYYYAAVSNLILRFVWALPLIKTLPEWIHNT